MSFFEKLLIILSICFLASMPLFFNYHPTASTNAFSRQNLSRNCEIIHRRLAKKTHFAKLRLVKMDKRLKANAKILGATLRKPFSDTEPFVQKKYARLPAHLQDKPTFIKQLAYEWQQIKKSIARIFRKPPKPAIIVVSQPMPTHPDLESP